MDVSNLVSVSCKIVTSDCDGFHQWWPPEVHHILCTAPALTCHRILISAGCAMLYMVTYGYGQFRWWNCTPFPTTIIMVILCIVYISSNCDPTLYLIFNKYWLYSSTRSYFFVSVVFIKLICLYIIAFILNLLLL